MHCLIMDRTYSVVGMIDVYASVIWAIRYDSAGDFELYLPVELVPFDCVKRDNYIALDGHDGVMVIETIEIKTDAENGNFATISGRSLESILDRRIIWGRTVLKGPFQDGIERLLNENVIRPADELRKIDNFVFERSSDPRFQGLAVDAQYRGENLYDVISELCHDRGVGFKVAPDYDTGGFVFTLYFGTDRSYDQNDVLPVVFSAEFENLARSDYIETSTVTKNSALVIGGEDTDDLGNSVVRTAEVTRHKAAGMQRREISVDGSSANRNSEDGGKIPLNDYLSQLRELGSQSLSETGSPEVFEGEVDYRVQYLYGIDFFIGDVVQVGNEYERRAKCRITEIVVSADQNGEMMTPTFSTVSD